MAKKDLIPFKKGKDWNGNKDGRPVGSISVISRLKKEFREHPEKFEEFLTRYLKNPQNEKHIAEMIDGKPQQSVQMEVILPTPIIPIDEIRPNNSDNEDNKAK